MAEAGKETGVRRLTFATAVGVVLLNVAPAWAEVSSPPASAAVTSVDDPWEHANRRAYGLGQGFDRRVFRPVAMGYKHALPSPLRQAIRNFLNNLNEPGTIINDILQVRVKRAARSIGRFVINSTIGLVGLLDVATDAGLARQDNSFSATLGRYGVKTGPYLYLPVVGPSTVRGLFGWGVDLVLDPLYWVNYPQKLAVGISRELVSGVDLRAESDSTLNALTNEATDPYATLRSAYLQNQQSQIDGGANQAQPLPEFEDVAPPASSSPSPPEPDNAQPPASDQAPAPTPAPPPAPAPDSTPAPTPDSAALQR
jgi:phospholipid-binding lipoprotein MlaA